MSCIFVFRACGLGVGPGGSVIYLALMNDDSPETSTERDDEKSDTEMPFKPFPLLNALSGLMMLQFDMLADRSTRNEVCPVFGVPLIRRVLDNVIPDNFCPDPVLGTLFDILDNEEDLDGDPELITIITYNASLVACSLFPDKLHWRHEESNVGSCGVIGAEEVIHKRGKSYTSEDELDELDSPVSSIIQDAGRFSPLSLLPKWMAKGNQGRNVLRYQLLKDAWKDAE